MAKKKESKASYEGMSKEQLNAKLGEFQETQFRLKFRHASNPLKNPMQIRQARREVARLKTLLQQKEKEVTHGTKNR